MHIHCAYDPCGMVVVYCFIIVFYFVFNLDDEKRILDTIPPTMQSFHGVLEPRKYFVVKQIGCGSCGKVKNL